MNHPSDSLFRLYIAGTLLINLLDNIQTSYLPIAGFKQSTGCIDGITLNELQELKEQTADGKPRERVLAAIGRKQSDYMHTLASRHGLVEKTILNWLDRFKEQPLNEAPYNEPPPGGPAKIEDEERRTRRAYVQTIPQIIVEQPHTYGFL